MRRIEPFLMAEIIAIRGQLGRHIRDTLQTLAEQEECMDKRAAARTGCLCNDLARLHVHTHRLMVQLVPLMRRLMDRVDDLEERYWHLDDYSYFLDLKKADRGKPLPTSPQGECHNAQRGSTRISAR